MPLYPATLPRPSVDGYGLSPFDPVVRSRFAAGRKQSRERQRTPPTAIAVRWIFTEAELAVFESWWHHVALDGAGAFDIELANGQGINSVTASFADDWRMEALESGAYAVTANLHARVMPSA